MFKRYFVWFGVKVINWDEMNIVWGVDFQFCVINQCWCGRICVGGIVVNIFIVGSDVMDLWFSNGRGCSI